MYELRKTKDFEKSLKKIRRSGKLTDKIQDDINLIINLLLKNELLPKKFRDHQLKGGLNMYRECHIRSGLLLIYEMINNELVLVLIDIGSHSYIFE